MGSLQVMLEFPKMKLTRLEMAGVIPAEGPVGTNVVEKGIKTPAKTRTLS